MRALADGRVRWGFWPPGEGRDRDGKGIWLEGTGVLDIGDDNRSADEDEELEKVVSGEETEDVEVEEEDGGSVEEEIETIEKGRGFFGALELSSDDDTSGDGDEDYEELEDDDKGDEVTERAEHGEGAEEGEKVEKI